jgi:hypothetical protein
MNNWFSHNPGTVLFVPVLVVVSYCLVWLTFFFKSLIYYGLVDRGIIKSACARRGYTPVIQKAIPCTSQCSLLPKAVYKNCTANSHTSVQLFLVVVVSLFSVRRNRIKI